MLSYLLTVIKTTYRKSPVSVHIFKLFLYIKMDYFEKAACKIYNEGKYILFATF